MGYDITCTGFLWSVWIETKVEIGRIKSFRIDFFLWAPERYNYKLRVCFDEEEKNLGNESESLVLDKYKDQ